MSRKEELLEVSCKDYYMYGNIIKDLINKDIINEYIKKISNDKFNVTGSCIFKTDYITHSELFIYNLDRFIYFYKHKLLIEEGESRYILEVVLKSKYAKLLLEKSFCFDLENIQHYNMEYKKILCDNFYKNLRFLKFTFNEILKKEKIDVDKKELSEDNIDNIFKFLCGLTNCKRNHIFCLFEKLDSRTVKDGILDYFVHMWEDVVEQYKTKNKYLKLLEI